jgi:hypothetical protein
MEFQNGGLLPKGLPELIAQFTPYEHYDRLKVIVHHKRERSGVSGCFESDDGYSIHLWPTVISFNILGRSFGTISFRQWYRYLRVSMHELGHLASMPLCSSHSHIYSTGFTHDEHLLASTNRIEKLANDWADLAISKILSSDPRMGQPPGFITGYPGVHTFHIRNCHGTDDHYGKFALKRIDEWRGYYSGGQ